MSESKDMSDLSKEDDSMSQKENTANPDSEVRRSTRDRKLTEKAQQNLEDDTARVAKKLNAAYERWRQCASKTRKCLLKPQSLDELIELNVDLIKQSEEVLHTYEDLRKLSAPSRDVVMKVDNCVAISEELKEILQDRRLQHPDEFDTHQACQQTRVMKHAHPSIFGASSSNVTGKSSISSMKAKADAELAEKMEKARALQAEQAQKTKILQLQLKMEEEKMRLEAIKVNSDVKAAEAKSKILQDVYDNESQASGMDIHHSSHIMWNPSAPSFEPVDSNPAETTVDHDDGDNKYKPPQDDITKLAQLLSQSITSNRLPPPKPSVFSGDPLKFTEWRMTFWALVEGKGLSASERMFYLREYLAGQAKRSVDGYFYPDSEDAYQQAWRVLDERYGNPFVIKQAIREKITKWPRIAAKDVYALRDLCDFLSATARAIPHVQGLEILNDCEENRKILEKLPEWLVQRWNRAVVEEMSKSQIYPDFQAFVDFLESETQVACNPICSPFLLKSDTKEKLTWKKQSVVADTVVERTSLAVKDSTQSLKDSAQQTSKESTLSSAKFKPNSLPQIEKARLPCIFCEDINHSIPTCSVFGKKDMSEKVDFIRSNHLCFACLKKGHYSSECRRRHTCKICKRRHPTCLHDNKIDQTKELKSENINPQAQATSHNVKRLKITSSIVPVWLSSTDQPDKEVLTYALLDTQSDTSFVLDDIVDTWSERAKDVTLKIRTMTSTGTILDCKRIDGLQVRGMYSDKTIPLPTIYTRNFIPVEKSHIPTHETALQWPHLERIAHEIPPLQTCDVGLLIGYDCPLALTPREVISGNETEPFAQRTDIGWSVIGLSNPCLDKHSSLNLRTSVKEIPTVSPREVVNALERDFAADEYGLDKKVSQEDIMFLEMMKTHTRQREDGHIELPLPVKSHDVTLPNNKRLAFVRLECLKRKLKSDSRYAAHYKAFMADIIEKGEAELVSKEGTPGRTNYVSPQET